MSNMGHVLAVSKHAKVDCYGQKKYKSWICLYIGLPINEQKDNKNCHTAN